MAVHAIVNDAFSPDNYMSHTGIPSFQPYLLNPPSFNFDYFIPSIVSPPF